MFKIFITKKEQAVNDFHHILILFSSEVKEITDQAPVQVHHYKQTVLMWVRFFFVENSFTLWVLVNWYLFLVIVIVKNTVLRPVIKLKRKKPQNQTL